MNIALLVVGIILLFLGFAVDVRTGGNAGIKWIARIVFIIIGIALVVLALMLIDGMLVLPPMY